MNKKPLLIVFTGAGFSADSGLQTFRGSGGLWNNYKIQDVCNWNTWKNNYQLVHEFYDNLREQWCIPHKGYSLLKQLDEFYDVHHYTTNIDALYENAQIPCTHIHGELKNIKCMECGEISDIGACSLQEAIDGELVKHNHTCQQSLVHQYKPAITFYNESYDDYPGLGQLKASLKTLNSNDMVLIIGSSLEVVPVDYWLRHTRCYKYNINPDKSAGYGRDIKHWRNIPLTAIQGLEQYLITLSQYRTSS